MRTKNRCNIFRGTWRVEDYCSFMAIRATNGETAHYFWTFFGVILTQSGADHPGVEFSLTMFEDPGCQLPESITRSLALNPQLVSVGLCLSSSLSIGCSWVAMRALPDFITNMRLACLKLRTVGDKVHISES